MNWNSRTKQSPWKNNFILRNARLKIYEYFHFPPTCLWLMLKMKIFLRNFLFVTFHPSLRRLSSSTLSPISRIPQLDLLRRILRQTLNQFVGCWWFSSILQRCRKNCSNWIEMQSFSLHLYLKRRRKSFY